MATEPQLQPFPQVFQVTTLSAGNGTATTPSINVGDSGTGIYRPAQNEMAFTFGGTRKINLSAAGISGATAGSFYAKDGTASATTPTLIPNKADEDSGLGWVSADNLALIAGGLQAVRVEDPADLAATETSLWLYDKDNNAVEQVTVGAAESGGAGKKVLCINN